MTWEWILIVLLGAFGIGAPVILLAMVADHHLNNDRPSAPVAKEDEE